MTSTEPADADGPTGTHGVTLGGARGVGLPPGTGRRARVAGVAALLLACAADLLIMLANGVALSPGALVLLACAAAVLWPAARRPRRLTPVIRTVGPVAASLAWTVIGVTGVTGDPVLFGPGEATLLLCLLLIAIRSCPPRWAVAGALLTGVALVGLPLRVGLEGGGAVVLAVLVVLGGITAGFAGNLRSLDERRRVAIAATRRAERLDMAANLHDFVAHHVTGILVQTQVARMLARTEPDRLDPVLAGIENAAAEALTSMRRVVGLLREINDGDGGNGTSTGETGTGDDRAERRPHEDLTAIPELVTGLPRRGGPEATLVSDPAIPATLPSQVQVAACRVVQEALTNVLRHAPEATDVTVRLDYDQRSLRVAVRDDGPGRAAVPAGVHDGGFGLIGLTERVSALGGTLRAGPVTEGGWEVAATLPLDAPR